MEPRHEAATPEVRTAAPDKDGIWRHFERWVRTSPPLEGRGRELKSIYSEALAGEGLEGAEIERRITLIGDELRSLDRDHGVVYWDAVFKFGGGPDRPLRLLTEVVRGVPPGNALDGAMGNGRNAVYLASLGWRVTGYDISPEALRLARARAGRLGLAPNMLLAGHGEFDLGRDRWDLIVLSYNVVDSGDLEKIFGAAIWTSLRRGGRIVCEGNFCEPFVRGLFALRPAGFRLELYSDSKGMLDGWVAPGTVGRVTRAVILKAA